MSAELLSGRLRAYGETSADRDAVVYVPDPQDPDSQQRLSYRQLDMDARRLASALDRLGVRRGDRLMLLHPPGLEFVRAFVACQYAGFTAVPAPAPDGQHHRALRLAGIVENCQAAAVLTASAVLPDVQAWQHRVDRPDLPCLCTDEMIRDEPGVPRAGDEWTALDPSPRDVAFLQYTSGSTAAPRGVVVDQGNVAANIAAFLRLTHSGPGVTAGGWLPMHHDMGLIAHLLTPLYTGGTSVLMSPMAFLRHPAGWLRLIGRFGVSLSAAPNFALDLCTRRTRDVDLAGVDLSGLRTLVVGSEPILARTLDEFTARFAAVGLSPEAVCPGYGLAEATLAVSLSSSRLPAVITPVDARGLATDRFLPSPHATDPGTRRIVDCGPVDGCEVLVVDPNTLRVCPRRQVGEIWLRGPSVARGYWPSSPGTEAFDSVTADGDGGWLRTGDLGVFEGGQLYLTGRRKEVMIVRGQNLYPQDLEGEARWLEDALAHGVGAAFTVATPHEEIVLVHECRASGRSARELDAIAGRVQASLARQFGVGANVVLVRIGAIPRTTSGKVQRVGAASMFRAGRFDPLAERLTVAVRRTLQSSAEDLRAWLVRRLAHYRQLPEESISSQAPLADYGLDSLLAVSLCGDIEDHLQVVLDPAVVWNHPSIDALVGYLQGDDHTVTPVAAQATS